MNILSHFLNFIFPSEALSYAINYPLKVAFSKLGFLQEINGLFSQSSKKLLSVSHFIDMFCVPFLLLNSYFLTGLEI